MMKPMPTWSKDDIDQMEAGRAIDLLVARLTSPRGWDEIYHPQGSCGFTGCSMCEPSCPRYSSDIALAWLVADKIPRFAIQRNPDGSYTAGQKDEQHMLYWQECADAPTVTLAICRAALKVYWS